MAGRRAQVDRLLDAERDLRSGARAAQAGQEQSRQAGARLQAARRNATREEWDAFIDESLDDALGPGWRNSR